MAEIGKAELDKFMERIHAARTRLAQQVSGIESAEARAVLNQLEESCEELSIAEEELRQQHEEVLVSRYALERERQRYLSFFELAPDAYLVTDAQGVIREANRAALTLLAASRAGLIGKPLVLFVPPERRREFRISVLRVAERRSLHDWNMAFQLRQGRTLPVSLTVTALTGIDGTLELRWMIRDATARRQFEEELEHRVAQRTAELEIATREKSEALDREHVLRQRAEEADRAKDAFLAMLSHELRTPMTALVGWVHLLVHGALDEETHQRALQALERSTKAQARLINDILDVSRIITGKLQLDMKSIDLAPVVSNAVSLLLPNAAQRELTLRYETTVEHAWLIGDPERLQQIVWNLLSNAMKFTPAGGTIDVRLKREGDEVTLSVADTGIGIEPAFLSRIFERFHQVDNSSTRLHGGLGLGLAIARYLVESQAGEIRAESAGAGKGSTFTVTFPVVGELERSSRAPEPEPSAEAAVTSVLLVEDDPDTREMLRVALSMLGLRISVAGSVREALALLPKLHLDVLVSDLGLPGEDGFSLIRQVRRLPPSQGGTVPAIALSGYLLPETRHRALDAGFQVLVTKPVAPEQLAAVVRELAARSPSRTSS